MQLLSKSYIALPLVIKERGGGAQEVAYEAVSDQGPVWVQTEDKIPNASKSIWSDLYGQYSFNIPKY